MMRIMRTSTRVGRPSHFRSRWSSETRVETPGNAHQKLVHGEHGCFEGDHPHHWPVHNTNLRPKRQSWPNADARSAATARHARDCYDGVQVGIRGLLLDPSTSFRSMSMRIVTALTREIDLDRHGGKLGFRVCGANLLGDLVTLVG